MPSPYLMWRLMKRTNFTNIRTLKIKNISHLKPFTDLYYRELIWQQTLPPKTLTAWISQIFIFKKNQHFEYNYSTFSKHNFNIFPKMLN
jgi:hypothetical protein